uniref:Putative ATPase domain containing protein n=1 Tax=viral metagenome TaxID=1070528 RepID=A0A6M3JQN4_9ZZZZ
MQLCEKYRPRGWGEFVGQEKLIARVRAVVGRVGFGEGSGEAVLIAGPSGTGKTTLAHLIARELGATDLAVEELDGDACSVDAVRELADRIGLSTLYGGPRGWRVYIVNECHAMSPKAVQAWLTLLERLPAWRLIVFTTTEDVTTDLFGNFTGPFASRCKVFGFSNQSLAKPMAERARAIAQAEAMDGKPESAYLRLVQDCKNNFRAVLQRIDAGEMLEV